MSFIESSLESATWPIGSVVALAIDAMRAKAPSSKKSDQHAFAVPSAFAPLSDHVAMQIGCIPRLLLCYFIFATYYVDWRVWAQTLSLSWALPIILRDVAICLLVGSVDSFLLLSDFSPFKNSMARHKFNPRYPNLMTHNGTSSLVREAFWCCVTAAIAGCMEVGVLHCYASGVCLAYYTSDAWWTDARTVILMVTWFYTQNVQFYTMHRLLHKWGTTSIPDVGAWLYKHVHSLHHESKNPTAFSGISMHPIEGVLYLSYALFPVLLGGHFFAFFYIKTNLIAAAMLGHSAFESPGTGSMPHYLHHSLVQVNYAESHVPLDYWLGTWAATEAEAAASIKKRMKHA